MPEQKNESEVVERAEAVMKMCRLLEVARWNFLENCRRSLSSAMPPQQFMHLMAVRQALPCNLGRIEQLTGLTSAGASIFVNKMVRAGIIERAEDPGDRRNLVIRFTSAGADFVSGIEENLNRCMQKRFRDCTLDELLIIESASRIVCAKLDPAP